MNGLAVGHWTISGQRDHSFVYDQTWLDTDGSRPISLSMPLIPSSESYRGEIVESFFDNLLPNNAEIRRRIQTRFGASSMGAFDLLSEIGRDCIGALQIGSPDETPQNVQQIQAMPLDEHAVAEELRSVTRPPPLGQKEDDAFRISLAGAQEKSAFLWHEEQWQRPIAATPTTHIFKLPLGVVGNMGADLSTSVENEWLCRQIVHEFGLPIAECAIADFEDQHVLVVERFDRRLSNDGTWWIRRPQEDMCQATATPPDFKYESDGGPGIAAISDLLLGSRNSIDDRRTFLRAQIIYWMLCAIDGHAKNFSVHIESHGRFSLTPLYDVMSAYPILGGQANQLAPQKARMAMAAIGKNRHYKWHEIQPRHWISTAAQIGLASAVEEDMARIANEANEVVERVSLLLPDNFPHSVSDPIFDGVQRTAERIRDAIF